MKTMVKDGDGDPPTSTVPLDSSRAVPTDDVTSVVLPARSAAHVPEQAAFSWSRFVAKTQYLTVSGIFSCSAVLPAKVWSLRCA